MALDNRITDLEIRLTHLDDTVEVLNRTIIDQQDRIDRLERSLKQLLSEHERIRDAVAPEIVDTRPPHY